MSTPAPVGEGLLEGLKEVAELLAAWARPAALVGGVAFVLRVRPRFTDDFDVAVTVPKEATEDFLALARRLGFAFDAAGRRFFHEAGLLPLRSPRGFRVDVMVADDVLLESAVRRATAVALGDVSVTVITPEDLLLLKLDANRHVDMDDALAIKDALLPSLDRDYLEHQARASGLLEPLERLLGKR